MLGCPSVTLMDTIEAHVGHADKVTSDILRCPTVTLMDRSEAHVGHADKVTSDILRCPTVAMRLHLFVPIAP